MKKAYAQPVAYYNEILLDDGQLCRLNIRNHTELFPLGTRLRVDYTVDDACVLSMRQCFMTHSEMYFVSSFHIVLAPCIIAMIYVQMMHLDNLNCSKK